MSSRTMLRFSMPIFPAVFLLSAMASCSSTTFRSPRRLPRAVSSASTERADLHSAGAQEVARRALILRSLAAVDVYPRSDEHFSPEAIRHPEAEQAELVKGLETEGPRADAAQAERE